MNTTLTPATPADTPTSMMADVLDAILAEACAGTLASYRTRRDDADTPRVLVRYACAERPGATTWRPALLLEHAADSERATVLLLDAQPRRRVDVHRSSIHHPAQPSLQPAAPTFQGLPMLLAAAATALTLTACGGGSDVGAPDNGTCYVAGLAVPSCGTPAPPDTRNHVPAQPDRASAV